MAGKRDAGAGTVRRLPNGAWKGQISAGFDPTGKRVRKAVTAPTKHEVLEKMADLRAELERDGLVFTRQQPLGDYLFSWNEEVVQPTLEWSTYALYRGFIKNHIQSVPHLARIPVNRVTTAQLQQLFGNLLRVKKLAPSSVKRIQAMLSGAFSSAMRQQIITANPVKGTRLPRMTTKEIEPYSLDEARQLIEEAAKDHYGILFLILAATGLRAGELLGLRLIDVDFEQRLVYVRGQIVPQGGVGLIRKATKTAAGSRTLALPAAVVPALQDWLVRRSRIGLDAKGNPKPGWVDSGYLFITRNGRPLNRHGMGRTFQCVRKRAGLRHQTPHGMRHFFATQQMLGRENPRIVQAQLGHSRVGITLDIYSHVVGVERNSMDRVASLLLPSRAEEA